MDGPLPILFVLLAGALVVRVALHYADKERVQVAATNRGWSDVQVSWAPFAPGWFFEKGERHYHVRYVDELGRSGEAYCKTGLLTGVYWREPEHAGGSSDAPRRGAPPEAPSVAPRRTACCFCADELASDAPDALRLVVRGRDESVGTPTLYAHRACLERRVAPGFPLPPPS